MLLWMLTLACTTGESDPDMERDVLWAVPSDALIGEAGQVELPQDRMPLPIGGTEMPVERISWRTGFSPVQTTVFFPSETLDPDSLPTPDQADSPGSVQIWDLTSGERVPCFAELDLFPQDEELPSLMVRPLVPMKTGHWVAVVVTADVRTETGDSISIPDWFQAVLDGEQVEGMSADDYRADLNRLESLGVTGVRFFSRFPVSDGGEPLRQMVSQVGLPSEWSLEPALYAEDSSLIPPGIHARAVGTFRVDNWLVEDRQFELADDGMPVAQAAGEADLFVYISEAAMASEPGTAPVWIFGHGVFSEPDNYLYQGDDVSGVAELAERAGAILIGTRWRGMTYTDVLTAVNVGNDFGRLPELSDKLAQGVANQVSLSRLILEGDLLDDPVFGGVADTSQLFYYGISLGGIQGAVMMANNPHIEHGVLHVGGGVWSTLLERSSHWPTFETLVSYSIPSAAERQVLYSLSQLFWDVSDPASFVDELSERSVLWQEAIGDEQVPNITTEILARGAKAPLMTPSATLPPLLDLAEAPASGPILVQFDSEYGMPPEGNRPAEVTGAHDAPRHWEGQQAQVLRFLDPDEPGVAEHFCGAEVCSASNTGD